MKKILLITNCLFFALSVNSQNSNKTIWFKHEILDKYHKCFLYSFFDFKPKSLNEPVGEVFGLKYFGYSIFGTGDTIKGFKYDKSIKGFQKWEKTKVFHYKMTIKKVSKTPESSKIEKTFFLLSQDLGKYTSEYFDSIDEYSISIPNNVLDSIDNALEKNYFIQRADSANYIYLISSGLSRGKNKFYIKSQKCIVKVSFRFQIKSYLFFKFKKRTVNNNIRNELIKIIKEIKYTNKNQKIQLWVV